jgi:hypothetical protein
MFIENDIKLIRPWLETRIDKINDPIAKEEMKKFIEQWSSEFPGKSTLEIISSK